MLFHIGVDQEIIENVLISYLLVHVQVLHLQKYLKFCCRKPV